MQDQSAKIGCLIVIVIILTQEILKMNSTNNDFDVHDYLKRKGIHIKKISGDELILDCFFCDPPDTKGHFSVNVKTTQCHCFKCCYKGNIFTLMKYFGDRMDNFHFDEKKAQQIEQQRKIEEVLWETMEFYHGSMTGDIRDYFLGRGFTAETIDKFKLGYARGGLRKHLSEKGLSLELCKKAGVIKEDGKDYFYEKIIFPYFYRNRVVLIRCRTNPNEAEKAYFPLKDYPIRLYNEDTLFNAQNVIICEGELDCLILIQMGFKHVVAIPGASSFKLEWIEKFRDCRFVYLALDADKSGEKGMLRIAEMLGEQARIVQLPKGMDVNGYFLAGNGKEDFESLLNKSMTRLELKIEAIERMPENHRKEEIKNLFDEFVSLDPIDLDHYSELIHKQFGIGKRAFNSMLKQLIEKNKHNGDWYDIESTPPDFDKNNTINNKQADKAYEMTDEERKEALELLIDPKMLTRFLDDTEKIRFVGEEQNKVILLLSKTSRLLDHPIDVLVKGLSSSGKNYEIENVARFIPEEDIKFFSDMTPKSLYHRKDILAHKVLIIAERNGAEQSDYVIRTMQSEKKLIFATVIKNPETARHETVDIEVQGPITFIETTTKSHIHDENETRSFDIFVDESEEQTKRIQQAKIMKYKGEIIDKEKITKPWKNAQRLLKPYRVYFPFADYITFDTKNVRSRRDHERFLALIEVIAFIHQYQREKKIINGIEFLVASIEDYTIAYGLAEKILFPTTSGISPKLELFIEKLWSLAEQRAMENNKQASEIKMTRKEIQEQLKQGRSTIQKNLKDAEKLDLINVDKKSDANKYYYQVTKKVDEIKKNYLINPTELSKKFNNLNNQTKPAQNENRQVNYKNNNKLSRPDQVVQPVI